MIKGITPTTSNHRNGLLAGFFLVLLMAFLSPTRSSATERYVAPTGSGEACSSNSPCSMTTGLSQTMSGDTLVFKDGVYDQAISYNDVISGQGDSQRTIYRAEHPRRAILRPTVGAYTSEGCNCFVIWVYGKSWVTFDGFVLDGAHIRSDVFYGNTAGSVHPNGITLQNSEVMNGYGNSCVAAGGTNNKFIGNKVHGCVGNPNASPYVAHAIYIGASGPAGPSHALVEGNETYDVDGYGIHLFHTDISDATVRRNFVHDVGRSGIIIGSGTGNRAYRNIVMNAGNSGILVAYEGANQSLVYNNTIYRSAYCIFVQYADDTTIANNLCLSNSDNRIIEGPNSTSVQAMSNLLSTDDGLVVNATAGDFHLRSTADSAINRGTDLGSPFDVDYEGNSISSGEPWDIGAFELGGIINPPPAPTPTPTPAPAGPITVDSVYSGYSIDPIDDGAIDASGGTATTWASDESNTDHFIEIALTDPQEIASATIYWAYNTDQRKYMSSQRVEVQAFIGSSFQTVASLTYAGDLASTSVTFAPVTTSKLRFLQPAGYGSPTYANVFWVTEVDYAGLPPQPAPAPTPAPGPIVDTIAPSFVAITSPANGSDVARSSTITVSASATDNVGVEKVKFYANGILFCTDATAPYECPFAVPRRAGRTYRLKAKAFDAAGNSRLSSIVKVTAR